MAERGLPSRLGYAGLFLGLAAALMFLRLLPLAGLGNPDAAPGAGGPGAAGWPLPDVMLALTMAWIVRRPDLLPAPVIALWVFAEDLLTLRPPGLWALIVLAATEFLRSRAATLRGLVFWLEYAVIAGVMLAMFLLNRAVLAIVMVPQPAFGLSLLQFLGTILAYPLAAAALHYGLGLRKPATGEVDDLGQKL